MMKFRYWGGAFLSLLFLFAIEASAHEYKGYTHTDFDISAEDVDMNNEEDIKKLLHHRATHIDLIYKDDSFKAPHAQARERVIFARSTRKPGVFNHNDVYSITAVSSTKTILNHGRYSQLIGDKYNLPAENPLAALFEDNVPEFSDSANPVCVNYQEGGQDRVACAIRQEVITIGLLTTIIGFHHAPVASFVDSPDCSNFKLDTTAKQVEDETNLEKKRELLKSYVEAIIKKTFELIVATFGEIARDGFDPSTREGQQEITVRIGEDISCFASGDFKYGTIYPFIMDPASGVVFINALDFDLNGLSVSLEDPNPIPYNNEGDIESNILTAFQKVLTNGSGDVENDLEDGASGFVKYHWDDPKVDGDEVDDYLERAVVPGTSVKESYIKVIDTTRGLRPEPSFFIVGSGIYLDSEMTEDSDDGCAIASTDHKPQSALLNLFLVIGVTVTVHLKRKLKPSQ